MAKTSLLLVVCIEFMMSCLGNTVDKQSSYLLEDCSSDAKRKGSTTARNIKEVHFYTTPLYEEKAYYTIAEGAILGPDSAAPGAVTLAILTRGIQPGFFTNTAAIAPKGTACVGDPAPHGSVLPYNYEVTSYVVIDGNHMRFTFAKAHPAGSTVAIGPYCPALIHDFSS